MKEHRTGLYRCLALRPPVLLHMDEGVVKLDPFLLVASYVSTGLEGATIQAQERASTSPRSFLPSPDPPSL